MKKVLIVSRHFPPMNTMGAKRYGYMCKYMHEYGWEPYVIASHARNGGFFGARTDLDIPVSQEQVKRIGMMGQVYPVDNLLFRLLLDYANSENSLRVFEYSSWGWFEKVKKDIDEDFISKVDIVLGTYPSVENLLVSRFISKKYKIPFIADIRDLMSDYTEGKQRNLKERMFERLTEKMIISDAAGVICTTKGFRYILSKRYRRKPIDVIYNGWEEYTNVLENEFNDCNTDYIYYAGSLYEHRLGSLEKVLQALSVTNSIPRMIIRSLGPHELEAKLRKLIISMGLGARVSILPAVEENIIRAEQARATINLIPSSLNPNDYALMSTLPGKLFELLRVGRPIMAIIAPNTELGDILKYTDKGIATADVEDMIAFFNGEYKRYCGNDGVMFYSRHNQAKRLCAFLDSFIENR